MIMKKFIFIVFIFALSGCFNNLSFSKEPSLYYTLPKVHKGKLDTNIEGNNHLYPIMINDLCGFVDVNGRMIIEPKFIYYEMLDKGYYIATTVDENTISGKRNYVDVSNGIYLISPNNKELKLSEGPAYVHLSRDKKYAIVNDESTGNYIFDMISQKKIFESKESYDIIEAYDDFFIKLTSTLYYMADYSGQDLSIRYEFFEGYIDDTVFFKNNKTTYWLDKSGNPFFQYDDCLVALSFYDGIVPVIDKNYRLNFLDEEYNILNSYEDLVSIYKQGNVYCALNNDKIQIFDLKGNRKSFDDEFGNILEYYYYNEEGSISSYNKDTSTFYIFDHNVELQGSYKIPEGYSILSLLYDDYLVLAKDNNSGIGSVKNDEFEWTLEPENDWFFAEDPYVYIFPNTNITRGLYDLSRKKIVLDPSYLVITIYDKNMIYVESAYFKGYANAKGQFVYVTPSYDFKSSD